MLFGPDLFSQAASHSGGDGTSQHTLLSGNVIQRENAQLGTSAWQIQPGHEATTEIQAYSNRTGVAPGNTITFYVSTHKNGTLYWIDIYRLGWYQGYGGRLITSLGSHVGRDQGYYDESSHILLDCGLCLIMKDTGLVEADWSPSYKMTVPSNWTTGVYLAKFTDVNGMQTYAPFDVLGNFKSTYIIVTPDATNAAFNDWGGYSLYNAGHTSLFSEADSQPKAVKVSLDRPYLQGDGASQVLIFEVNAIHWLERQGYNLSYISDVNLQEATGQLLNHAAYISIGHDEYWTKEMRNAIEKARDGGVGLAFLGANAGYWQIRLEPNSGGNPDRTVVCYKVSSARADLERDPFFGKDSTRLTAQWRDPVLNRPENALIGIMFSAQNQQQSFPWHLTDKVHSSLLTATGLVAGQAYGCDLVGYAWDRVFSNGATPSGLQIIGISPTKDASNVPDVSDTTYYIASSGAMVFAPGSMYWATALDNYRFSTSATIDPLCAGKDPVVPEIQRLMANIMDALPMIHSSRQLI